MAGFQRLLFKCCILGMMVVVLSPMGRKLIDISGSRFGRLVVLSRTGVQGYWDCLCDCGNESSVSGNNLRKGKTISCGCYQAEAAALTASIHRRKHGYEGTPIYKIWGRIKQRCMNSNAPNYSTYGGRGIEVCDRWKESFENFLSDMGERPSPLHSIDRIDKDGNYEPSNCRWATWEEQNNNHHCNRILEYDGTLMTMAEWARSLNVNYSSFAYHINKGRSILETLTKMRKV